MHKIIHTNHSTDVDNFQGEITEIPYIIKIPLSDERREFAYLSAGQASGGPSFSNLPEKLGEKRGAGERLLHPAGAIQAGIFF